MFRLGIMVLGIANLLSATALMIVGVLYINMITVNGFNFMSTVELIIMIVLEAVKWIAFYHIIKNNNMRWYMFYIIYNIPILILAFSIPLFLIVVAAYIIAYFVLNQVQKNGQKAALS